VRRNIAQAIAMYVHGTSCSEVSVEVLINDEGLWIEQADRLLVSYPCVYDTVRRRIITIDGQGRQQYLQVQVVQLALVSVELMR
jgi:hypothetical protein